MGGWVRTYVRAISLGRSVADVWYATRGLLRERERNVLV